MLSETETLFQAPEDAGTVASQILIMKSRWINQLPCSCAHAIQGPTDHPPGRYNCSSRSC